MRGNCPYKFPNHTIPKSNKYIARSQATLKLEGQHQDSPMATNDTPDQLFSIKRTIINYLQDESGATRYIDILGTYSKLEAAKAAARTALPDEGYIKDDFPIYDENDGKKQWTHGDGVIVFAKMGAGQELSVAIETTPNTEKLNGDSSGKIEGQIYYGRYLTANQQGRGKTLQKLTEPGG